MKIYRMLKKDLCICLIPVKTTLQLSANVNQTRTLRGRGIRCEYKTLQIQLKFWVLVPVRIFSIGSLYFLRHP